MRNSGRIAIWEILLYLVLLAGVVLGTIAIVSREADTEGMKKADLGCWLFEPADESFGLVFRSIRNKTIRLDLETKPGWCSFNVVLSKDGSELQVVVPVPKTYSEKKELKPGEDIIEHGNILVKYVKKEWGKTFLKIIFDKEEHDIVLLLCEDELYYKVT
ncbi:MAG: hypothetical protein ISS93_00080 [Candidatus Aenigmarchaeota archaeon]|nr:hypothetical protein [Candidatus Aenigmarchaeota archaeon]